MLHLLRTGNVLSWASSIFYKTLAIAVLLYQNKSSNVTALALKRLKVFHNHATMKIAIFAAVLSSVLQLNSAYAPLAGVTARSVKTSQDVDLSEFVSTPSSKDKKTRLVLATYAAVFNAIEYAQR